MNDEIHTVAIAGAASRLRQASKMIEDCVIYYTINEPSMRLPGLLLDSNNVDRGASKTCAYTDRDKNTEQCSFFRSVTGGRLVVVAFWN